ncbi:hypothetical protein AVEN_228344-1 [Araneus ventricosus]|uniref:Uncharacterized protein n=1 Tax=Araneus ventricosus TaxID=182803 RepID=A0A4Y2K9D0_ARAVE|nr:hypothetical protein AVEN_228344-1 [Araneus ventricosus]
MIEATAVHLKKKRIVPAVTRVIQLLVKLLEENNSGDGVLEELLEHLNDKFESLKVADREYESLFEPSDLNICLAQFSQSCLLIQ